MPKYRVVATAGHVDHGKSTLVKALTGIDPDRLKEEQERQMTIDLGFAWMELPGDLTVGIVDVPGHRDFIHNMLAGIGAIDLILLIVAADEGVMPQTLEHLEMLDLLQVKAGIVVITKVDAVEQDWLDLVVEDVREIVSDSTLANSPFVFTSAVTGVGLDHLKNTISRSLLAQPEPLDIARPRMAVDRVFTLRGHGTVVTGTLIEGHLRLGDQVILQPSGLKSRVRSLQTHGKTLEEASPASRVAVNLAGVQKEEVKRGEVLIAGTWLQPTMLFDAYLKSVPALERPLEHADEVQLFSGTASVLARLRLLESDQLVPNEWQWVQVVCEAPIALAHGDRFIIRRLSPADTLGGGVVVDAHPHRRHRRFDPDVWQFLSIVHSGSSQEQLLAHLQRTGPVSLKTIRGWLDLSSTSAREVLNEVVNDGKALLLEDSDSEETTIVVSSDVWFSLTSAAIEAVNIYHEKFPLRPGMSRGLLRRELRMRQTAFQAALGRWLCEGKLAVEGDIVALPDWDIVITKEQEEIIAKGLSLIRESPFTGKSEDEALALLGEELLAAMIASGRLERLPDGIVLAREDYENAKDLVLAFVRARESATVAQVRDLLESNRRFTLALLTRLDDEGFTHRQGDVRVLGRKALRDSN